VVSLLIAGLTWLSFGKTSVIFQPIHKDIMEYFVIYIFYQSLFFLGAIYFKSSNFNKTILCFCGVILGFVLAASSIFVIFLGSFFFDWWQVLELYGKTIQLVLTIVVPPCAWLITYLRLYESEI
jgi:hypothetical protein